MYICVPAQEDQRSVLGVLPQVIVCLVLLDLIDLELTDWAGLPGQ